MERLTRMIAGYPHGAEGITKDTLTGMYCRGEFEATACVEKLAEYENLEQQGLLVKLPCAVGTTLYAVSFKIYCKYEESGYLIGEDINCAFCNNRCKSKKEWFIHEIKAELPVIANLILYKDNPSDDFMIYLTREQAEQVLKEMEGKNE